MKTENVRTCFGVGVLLVAILCTGVFAKDIYVDKSAPGPHDGTTWEKAFLYLQDGLAVAVAGDTILIAKGEYYPDERTIDPNILTRGPDRLVPAHQ